MLSATSLAGKIRIPGCLLVGRAEPDARLSSSKSALQRVSKIQVDHIQRHSSGISTTAKTLNKIVLADAWGRSGTSGNGVIGSKAAVGTDARCRFVDISLFETAPREADCCPLGNEVAETAVRAWH